ncbi:hypothetical protein HALDL1_16125 [Halobacterium sp. DL1]|jgi:predicted PurR-regulated permease PerM|nr:hypothetical protein HALDL1_16125 [Halobacterium sp. DL1]
MSVHVDGRKLFFGLLLAVFGLLVAQLLQPFLTFLLAALLFAFVLAPLQRRLAPEIGDGPAAFALVVGAALAVAAPVAILVRTLPADVSSVSRTVQDLFTRRRIDQRLDRLLGVDVPVESLVSDVPRQLGDILVGDISTLVSGATHAFLGLVLLVFLLYYLLKDGDRLVAWIRDVTPLDDDVQQALFDGAAETTWAVLKGHVLVAFVQGVVAGVGLFVVGIPHVVFWTAVMMVVELFPVVGVAAVLGPAVIYLGLTNRLLEAGFLLVYGLTAVAVVDDLLRAKVVGRGSELHSGTVLLGVFSGVYVFGVMGLFYGPIVVGFFKQLVVLFEENYGGT